MYQRIWSHSHHLQTHHRANMILPMTVNTANQISNEAIKGKIIGNARNRNRQTHRRATMIFLKKVIIKASAAIKIYIQEKGSYQIMCKINGKVADDSV